MYGHMYEALTSMDRQVFAEQKVGKMFWGYPDLVTKFHDELYPALLEKCNKRREEGENGQSGNPQPVDEPLPPDEHPPSTTSRSSFVLRPANTDWDSQSNVDDIGTRVALSDVIEDVRSTPEKSKGLRMGHSKEESEE